MFRKTFSAITIILITFFSHNIYSQSKSVPTTIEGRVIETGRPVEFASVVLKNNNNIVVSGALTDSSGIFRLKANGPGSYSLEISFVGYNTKHIEVSVKHGVNKLSEPILISQSVSILAEASVTATYNEKHTDIEKTRINPSASIAASRGSITDLLRSASMVSIDNNNSISIRGNSKILILIDGIPSTIGSLDGIPASLAQSIEIITNPDARYDSEGTGGIINIITKKERGEGLSLSSSLNWGVTDRVNGDINVMFSAKGWNFGAGYSGKYHVEEVQSELDRLFYSSSNTIEQKIFSLQKQKTNTVSFNAVKKLKNGDQFTLNLKYFNPEINNHQQISGINSTASEMILVNRVNEFNHLRDLGEVIADYKKIIVKDISDITFRASFSRTKGQRPSKYYENGLFSMKALGGGHPTNYSFQTDYTYKISKNTLLDAGLRYFHRGNTFKFDTYQYDTLSHDWIYNQFFSADLTHSEDIGSVYFNITGKLNSKLSYKLGIRTEYGLSDLRIVKENEEIRTDNLFIAPFLLIKKDISDISSLSFSISKRITRPSYIQINPYINMLDKSVYETGNRYIKPEQITKFELMYNYSKNGTSFNSSLYYSTISDFISQVSSLYGDDALMLTYVNGESNIRTGADINIRHKFSKTININSGMSLFYGETKGRYNGFDLSSSSVMWSGNMALNLIPGKKSEIAIQYFYTSPATYPQFKTRAIHFMDIALKRVLIKDKLNASVVLSDVLNTKRWDITSDNSIYRLNNNSKNQSRVLWIGLTFNLNRIQQNRLQKKDDEGDQQGLIRIGY